jgi:superoxide reductase
MKVYQNVENKKIIVSNEELNIEGWREVKAGEVDAAQEKHVPVYEVKCGKVRVAVGSVMHPMTVEHSIEWVLLVTTQGYQVKYLSPETSPEVAFGLSAGEKVVGVYAYCNLHGLWKA